MDNPARRTRSTGPVAPGSRGELISSTHVGVPTSQLFGDPSGSRYAVPGRIVRGTVIAAYQALQCYEVSTDFGRFRCSFAGATRGMIGARESGGFLPGSIVTVSIVPESPLTNGIILGGASYPVSGKESSETPTHQSSWPQVAGLVLDRNALTGYRTFADQSYQEFRKIPNLNVWSPDTLDGEWGVHNQQGAGVAVEMFRSWIGAGPLSGISFWADSQHTRLVGCYFEHRTLGREYEDRALGPGIVEVDRRVLYPTDAVFDNSPQVLRVSGPQYGGEQEFRSYREKDNLEGRPGDTARPALYHEYRGLDGVWAVTAAGSITLRKSLTVMVPTEQRTPLRAGDGRQSGEPNQPYSPVDEAATHTDAVKSIRMLQFSPEPGETDTTIGMAIRARGFAKQLINWQARGGFSKLSRQWKEQPVPKRVFGEDASSQVEVLPIGPGAWKEAPAVVQLNLDPYGAKKRFVVGTSLISLTEDGGVVLEDAFGSRVLMTGGNVAIQAAGNLVLEAGKNITMRSGSDTAIQAGRHLEASAVDGRATVAAADRTSIIGGVKGNGGVVIESLAKSRVSTPESESGNYDAGGEGVSITSASTVTMKCQDDIRFSSRGIFGNAVEGVWWKISSTDSLYFFGNDLVLRPGADEPLLRIGRSTILQHTHVGVLSYGQFIFHGRTNALNPDGHRDDWATRMQGADTFPGFVDYHSQQPINRPGARGRFLKSTEYNIPGKEFYAIPEPPWAEWLRGADFDASSAILTAVMGSLAIDGQIQSPGRTTAAVGQVEVNRTFNPPDESGTDSNDIVDLSVHQNSLDDSLRGI